MCILVGITRTWMDICVSTSAMKKMRESLWAMTDDHMRHCLYAKHLTLCEPERHIWRIWRPHRTPKSEKIYELVPSLRLCRNKNDVDGHMWAYINHRKIEKSRCNAPTLRPWRTKMVAHTECADRKFFLPSHKRKLYAICAPASNPKKSRFTNTTLRQCL